MKTWWLGIDTKYCSYVELKYRKIVAQGWGDLGSLVSLKQFFPHNQNDFFHVIQLLGDVAYKDANHWFNTDKADRNPTRCPTVMWNLMDVKKGDLIVGIEGTMVMGICKMPSDGIASYRYDGEYDYAQTIGFPVEWIDWDSNIFGFTPTPSNQGILGIRGLNKDSQAVIDAWKKYCTK